MKSDEEIQAEVDNPYTKALIVMPAAKNAYLSESVTLNFPAEIPSVVNDASITLKGEMDVIIRKALAGMLVFVAHDDPEQAEKIDEFVSLIQEAEGDKLDFLASERVQKHFSVGKHSPDIHA